MRAARRLEALQSVDVGDARVDHDAVDFPFGNHGDQPAEISDHRISRHAGVGLQRIVVRKTDDLQRLIVEGLANGGNAGAAGAVDDAALPR